MNLFIIVFFVSINYSLSLAQLLPFVELSANEAANGPSARTWPSFKYDNNGGFWIFGGTGSFSGSKNDLWRFDRDSHTFTFIDGSNSTDDAATIADKPFARCDHASWVDSVGNFWIFGGVSTKGSFSDTWVYNASSGLSNKWSFVTGSNVTGEEVSGTLGTRSSTGHWTDVGDNCLYVFAGFKNNGRLQSVWKLDPSDPAPTWRYVIGSNVTGSVIVGQPTPRSYTSCDAAPNSGAYCFGGELTSNIYGSDLWRFNPVSNSKWGRPFVLGGPSERYGHQLVVNRSAGKVYVLFGWSYLAALSDVHSLTISTGQWSTIVSSSWIQRAYFRAAVDDRNMIYYFGGGTLSTIYNDVVSITCLPGEFNNAGTCIDCIAGSYSSTYNVSTCNLCSANTYSTLAGATSSSVCLSCPTGLVSTPGSSTCSCARGYQINGTECVPCPAGTYKDSIGNALCSLCPANTHSNILAATDNSICISCGENMAFISQACYFKPGYEPSETSCVACPAGTYKSRNGNWSCTPCGANSFSSATAATNSSVCVTIPTVTPSNGPTTNNANTNADILGINNDIFFAIVGSVVGVIIAAIVIAIIVIRNRLQKIMGANRQSIMSHQNPEVGSFPPFMSNIANNVIMPYSNNNSRISNIMGGEGVVHPSIGGTTSARYNNFTTVPMGMRTIGGATLATNGPNWQER